MLYQIITQKSTIASLSVSCDLCPYLPFFFRIRAHFCPCHLSLCLFEHVDVSSQLHSPTQRDDEIRMLQTHRDAHTLFVPSSLVILCVYCMFVYLIVCVCVCLQLKNCLSYCSDQSDGNLVHRINGDFTAPFLTDRSVHKKTMYHIFRDPVICSYECLVSNLDL